MKLKKLIIHPVLLALYPALFLFSNNLGQVNPASLAKPVALTLGCVVVAWGLLRLLLQDWSRSAGITTLLLVLFFSFGHVVNALPLKNAAVLVGIVCMLLALTGTFFIFKSKTLFEDGTKILNILSLVLVALVTFDIGRNQPGSDDLNYRSRANALQDLKAANSGSLPPDIYFIVLDAYARGDVLKSIYNFDNSAFIDFLEDSDFYVADQAAANYNQTGLSLASCLNLTYLDEWIMEIGEENLSRGPVNFNVSNNQVTKLLHNHGYNIVALKSKNLDLNIEAADLIFTPPITADSFQTALWNLTPLPFLAGEREPDVFSDFRQNTVFMFEKLAQVAAEIPGPKFVWAHFSVPHPPFLFGADGEPIKLEPILNNHDGDWLIKPGRLTPEQYRDHYRDQLIYTNKQMRKVISDILENSDQPPIILLFGDHGPRSRLFWEDAEKTDMWESMAILSAYHLPGGGHRWLYPDISPVNSFRVIFNHYFGSRIELLPDISYFSSAKYLYKVQDVTERVKAGDGQ